MRYDVVIVGAGSAGCVLASRLSEDPNCSILLLEAGPDYPDEQHLPDHIKYGVRPWYDDTDIDAHTWGYMATATNDRQPFRLPRGKVVGGSSAINGQVFFRGIPEDFDEWVEAGNDEWAYLKVLPYFRKSETDLDFPGDDFHGSDGPIPVRRYSADELLPHSKAFLNACLAKGYPQTSDLNAPDSTGVGAYPLNRIDGIRMSAAITYLKMARHRLNLTVRGDVLVRRILFDGLHAVGLEAESGDEVFQIEAGQVILSGGAINSPQLLMLSGIGPKEHLSEMGITTVHDLPGVGQNLRDHPAVFLTYAAQNEIPGGRTTVQLAMRYTTPGSRFVNDMQMRPFPMQRTEHLPVTFDIHDEGAPTGFSIGMQKAVSSGTLRLRSADPKEQPELDYRYLTDPYDRERMRGAVRLCVEISESPEHDLFPVTRISPTDEDLATDDALDRWLFANVMTQHHSSGTCKMGPSTDPMAVVDQYCRVHGLENLRVIDASVMPDVVRANTNATTIMIAEKLADWLSTGAH